MDSQEKLNQTNPGLEYSSETELSGLVSVKVRSLFTGDSLPCDFYFPAVFENEDTLRPERVLARGEQYLEETRRAFLDEEIDALYIEPKDENEFLNYLNSQSQRVIKSQEVSSEKKTEMLFDNAEVVVKRVFRENPSASSILIGKQIVEDFAQLITSEEVSATALLSLFSKDFYTFSHCVQVSTLGMSFCKFLGWSKPQITDFGLGTLFHDLGKNKISDSILNKPGRLEKWEFDIVKQHSLSGYQQLKKTNAFSKNQLDAVLYHHEAMDGSGYPDGLSGNEIPLFARLAHVVDVFDALTSERVYKKALPRRDAIKLMRNEIFTSFDEKLLNTCAAFIEEPDSSSNASENRIRAVLGTPISLQCEPLGTKMKSRLIGMEPDRYIIFSLSNPVQFAKLQKGMPLIARYLYDGEAFGFKETILSTVPDPQLVLTTYPKKLETLNLRSEERHKCILPAIVEVRENECRSVVVDLSYRGCRVKIKDPGEDKLPSFVRDDPITVCVSLPGEEEAVSLRGEIKNIDRIEDGTHMGIQFADRSQQAAGHWKAFIDDIIELVR